MVTVAPIFLIILILIIGVMVAGLSLILAGIFGKAKWSSPYCVACNYDLRGRGLEDTPTCPECGTDLAKPKAVGFLRQGHRPRLIWLGIVVIAALIFLLVAAGLFAPGVMQFGQHRQAHPPNLTNQSNAAVLTYTQNNIERSLGWDELAFRVRSGKLSNTETQQAFKVLVQHIKTQRQNGKPIFPFQQTGFITEAYRAGILPEADVIEFADAVYGKNPTLPKLNRLISVRNLGFSVKFGVNLGSHSLPIDHLWAIKQVLINGEPVPDDIKFDGTKYSVPMVDFTNTSLSLPPGDHVLTVIVESGYFDTRHMIGLSKHNVALEDWPPHIWRGEIAVKQTFTILGNDDHPVTLSDDPALDPGPDGISIKHLVVQPERGKKRLAIELEIKDNLASTFSYNIHVDLGGEDRMIGYMYYHSNTNSYHYGDLSHSILQDTLDPAIATADVTLKPAPWHVYYMSEVTEIWGETIVFKDVPLRRYDVREPAEDTVNE